MPVIAGADPTEIIDGPALLTYLGLGLDDGSPATTAVVALTNGIVYEAWGSPVYPIPWWVTSIALEVAARPTRNPKGLASWSRSVDDGARTERLPERAARAGVFLTDDERSQLVRGHQAARRKRFGTVRTRRGYLS